MKLDPVLKVRSTMVFVTLANPHSLLETVDLRSRYVGENGDAEGTLL